MQFTCRFHKQLHPRLYKVSTRHVSRISSLKTNRITLSNAARFQPLHFNQSSFFSTKDDSKSDDTENTVTESSDSSPAEQSQQISPTDSKPESLADGPIPLIRIHDENKPQLSISLPNRWPFKRLARKPETPPEPLNLQEMSQISTFSGLPAQNFLPSEAEKAKQAAEKLQEESKSDEEKRKESRKSFWKRFSMIVLATPMIMYIRDNRKAKKLAKRRAEYVSSATSDDARSIRDMAQLNNAELMDLYKWILHEECGDDPEGEMTVDRFGELVVRAVGIFKQRKGGDGVVRKDIRLSREYDDPLTPKEKKREVKWLAKKFEAVKDRRLASKSKELQPWDLSIFFTEYKLPSSSTIPLKTLFVALSQVTTDTLHLKAEIAFRIKSGQIEEVVPEMPFDEFVELIDDMVITGHFTTDSLIWRRSYFPSQFGVLRSEEIAKMIFDAANLDIEDAKVNGPKMISFEQFGEAVTILKQGRKMYESMVGFFLLSSYKPWVQLWYVSDRSRNEISEKERAEKREQKKLERKQKKKDEQEFKAQKLRADDVMIENLENSDRVEQEMHGQVHY